MKQIAMITSINFGNSDIKEIPKNLSPTTLYAMVVFDTIESRNEFASKFPKSFNLTSSIMFGRKYKNMEDMGIPLFYPFCSVRISSINAKTGYSNENGYRRMKRFYETIIKQYESEGSIDLSGMMEKNALLELPKKII